MIDGSVRSKEEIGTRSHIILENWTILGVFVGLLRTC